MYLLKSLMIKSVKYFLNVVLYVPTSIIVLFPACGITGFGLSMIGLVVGLLKISYLFIATTYAIPCIVLVCCYSLILRVVYRRRTMGLTGAGANGDGDITGAGRQQRQGHRTLRLVIPVIISFILCWGIFHACNVLNVNYYLTIMIIIGTDYSTYTDYILFKITDFLCYLFPTINSSLNPFLYALTNKNYRPAIRCPCRKSQASPAAAEMTRSSLE